MLVCTNHNTHTACNAKHIVKQRKSKKASKGHLVEQIALTWAEESPAQQSAYANSDFGYVLYHTQELITYSMSKKAVRP